MLGSSLPMAARAVVVTLFLTCVGPLPHVGSSDQGLSRDSPGGIWGSLVRVLGANSIEPDGVGGVTAISCPAVASCEAGGDAGLPRSRPFVIAETKGTWGAPEVVPGVASLSGNSSGVGGVVGVSCWAVGSCVLAGDYPDGSFVDSEVDGSWQLATALAGFASIPSSSLEVNAVSCSTGGSCAAGGTYTDNTGTSQPFVVNDSDGDWATPVEVPGGLISGDGKNARYPGSQVIAMACGAPGDCAAGGMFQSPIQAARRSAFLVNEVNGVWSDAITVPGVGDSNPAGSIIQTISCVRVGSCSAGGADSTGPFVIDESDGNWSAAHRFRLVGDVDANGVGTVAGVSCAAAGYCSAAGNLGGSKPGEFIANEVHGVWLDPIRVSGVTAGELYAIDCAAPEDCSASGTFNRTSKPSVGIVVNEVHGDVEPAIGVPGTMGPSNFDTLMYVISCGSPGSCVTGGATDSVAVLSTERPAGPPSLATVAPDRGRASGGTRVRLRGRGFRSALSVRFGSRLGTHIIVKGDSELIVSAPPGRGTVELTVETETGSTARSSRSRYTYQSTKPAKN